MILASDFEDFIKLLNYHQVYYLIVGGYAMAFHGKPRYTGDLDIWIDVSDYNAEKMLSVIDDFGFSSSNFKKNDFLKQNLINQIGFPPLRIDIITSIDGVTFTDAYSAKQIIDLDGFHANYIGLNELIQNKKSSARKIDLSDVEDLQKQKNKKL